MEKPLLLYMIYLLLLNTVIFSLSYLEYEVEGVTYMRMKFYVSGSKRKGEAVLDLKKVRRPYYSIH